MAYPASGTTIRSDINTVVYEASRADEFFIGEKVMPFYLQPARAGIYPKFVKGSGELLNADITVREPGGAYGRTRRAYTQDTFNCIDRGLEEAVDDTDRNDTARFFDAMVDSATMTMRKVRMGHEMRVAAAIMNSSNFTATAAAVNYTNALLATIDFVGDVQGCIDRMVADGVLPNTIVMSQAVWSRVRRSTLLTGYLRGSKSTDSRILAQPSEVVDLFAGDGIDQVLIARMPRNGAAKGQTFSSTPIWGNTYIWVGYVASGDPRTGGAGRTMVWNEEGGEYVTEVYREERERSNIVRVRQNTVEKVIDGSCGQLITTSYS